MSKAMSMSRFAKAGVKILEGTASVEELNDYVTEATRAKSAEPSLQKQLVELEGELAEARREAQALQEGLTRAAAEADEVRAKMNKLPSWLGEKLFEVLPEEARADLLSTQQWVMLVAPQADFMSWSTIASHIMRFKTTGIQVRNGWGLIVGTWTPETRDPAALKGNY
jgi:hypothetical protein